MNMKFIYKHLSVIKRKYDVFQKYLLQSIYMVTEYSIGTIFYIKGISIKGQRM